jgi:Protein of unknown function (DUF1329)
VAGNQSGLASIAMPQRCKTWSGRRNEVSLFSCGGNGFGSGNHDARPGGTMNMQHRKIHTSVRKLLDAVFEDQNMSGTSAAGPHEDYGLCSDPAQYDWHYIGKRNMIVPYNCALPRANVLRRVGQAAFMKSQPIRWENHYVWIVEKVMISPARW